MSDPASSDPPDRPAGSRRHHQVDDDLIAGFDRPGRRRLELRGFFASTLGAALFSWEIAFDLGAYHAVFYSRLFQLLVVSLVLLLGALALRREIRVRPWMVIELSLPVVWLVYRLFAPEVGGSSLYHNVDNILIGLIVATLPLTLWVLARILAPDYFALPNWRLKGTAVGIVVVIAVAGFLVGRFNYQVISCQEFVTAGDDTPANCRQAPLPAPASSPTPRPT